METTAVKVSPMEDVAAGFSQEQLQHLSSMRFMNRIDEHINIVTRAKISGVATHEFPDIKLILDIYYNDERIEDLSFNLSNFSYEEVVHLARNIRSNQYILREVDTLLSGDIE